MNFFDHQEQARKLTRRLIFLFAAAVIAIIVLVYALVTGVGLVATEGAAPWLRWDQLGMVAGGVLVVVGGGSLYKTAQLRSGGPAVATLLGGRRVAADPTDPHERKLMNVVEEMAVASGIPVPATYVLDHEPAINAFAAGYTTKDAAIGVTRGCIELLNRDELQGVVAHEFSHILNGDMRLNIRLTGWLHGILCIAMGGYLILRNAAWSSRGGSSRNKQGAGGILAVGIGLIVIGYAGVFFARLIQAAVSRQREFLADASAVQFTRAPWGLASALKKIGGIEQHGKVRTPHAQEASHMFFADALRSSFSSIFATHPALKTRIERIEAGFGPEMTEHRVAERRAERARAAAAETDGPPPKPAGGIPGMPGGKLPGNLPIPAMLAPGGAGSSEGPAGGTPDAGAASDDAGLANGMDSGVDSGTDRIGQSSGPAHSGSVGGIGLTDTADWRTGGAEAFVAAVGEPRPRHIQRSRSVREDLPLELLSAAHDPFRAQCVVYVLLFDSDREQRRAQIEILTNRTEARVIRELPHLLTPISNLPERLRLPMIDMLLPALREMSERQYRAFRANIDALIQADRKVSLFEFCLEQVLLRHLATTYDKRPRRRVLYKTLAPLREECRIILSSLARFGHAIDVEARAAYETGLNELFRDPSGMTYLPRDVAPVASISRALDKLDRTTPYAKRALLSACATTAAADGKIETVEAELLRAIADAVDCPVPI